MSRHGIKTNLWVLTASSLLFAFSGCSLEPPATTQERTALTQAGTTYEIPFEKREIPQLPPQPTWQDLLHYAFLNNGDLEASYFDWKTALTQVHIAGAYPNTNLTFSYSYLFSQERMKTWDRTTLGVGFDPSMTLQLPEKVRTAARGALAEAQAKRERFASAKFALQQKVLNLWLDDCLLAEQIRLQEESVQLSKMLIQTAQQRVRTGGLQQDLLKAQTELAMAQNELQNLQSQEQATRAQLNGVLGRVAEAPLPIPATMPTPRKLLADDARIIAVAVDKNPELAALAHDVAGRQSALEQARLAYLPDFSPQFSLTGNLSQSLGTMLTLPTNLIKIRGTINQTQDLIRGAQATLRQAKLDRGANFVATLYTLRDNERQIEFINTVLFPKTKLILSSSHQAYSNGALSFSDLVDSQRAVLDVRRVLVQAQIDREKRLAELENLAGVDIETLGIPATQPAASQPTATQNALPMETKPITNSHPATRHAPHYGKSY